MKTIKLTENEIKIIIKKIISEIKNPLNEDDVENFHVDAQDTLFISRDEYNLLLQTIQYVKDVLINSKDDGVLLKDVNNGFLNTIIDELNYNGILEYDTDEDVDYYYLANKNISPEIIDNEIEIIGHNMYTKVVD